MIRLTLGDCGGRPFWPFLIIVCGDVVLDVLLNLLLVWWLMLLAVGCGVGGLGASVELDLNLKLSLFIMLVDLFLVSDLDLACLSFDLGDAIADEDEEEVCGVDVLRELCELLLLLLLFMTGLFAKLLISLVELYFLFLDDIL